MPLCKTEHGFQSAETEAPVKIDVRLLNRIGVREWGLPSMVMPGQIWRSEKTGLIYCMTPRGDSEVNIERRRLEVVEVGQMSVMPDHWREALWVYVQRWPSSGCGYGPLLAINESERNSFLRQLGKELVEADEIGCRHIAHNIGQFAALEFETVSDRKFTAGTVV